MAWPRRDTRRIVVDGEEFLWHGQPCLCCSKTGIFTVGKPDTRYVLHIDLYADGFGYNRPRDVAAAIRWARQCGWSAEAGPIASMAFQQSIKDFVWLRSDQRHLD